MPVYASRNDLKDHWKGTPWLEIEDVEFFLLGSADRVAEGEEPSPAAVPDPVTDARASFLAGLDVASARRLVPATAQERIIVLSGEASLESRLGRVTLRRRDWFDIPETGATIRNFMPADAGGHRSEVEVARIAGHWKEAYRTSIFKLGPGRPADYHYHDCDEYWFIFRGHSEARLNGVDYKMGPGSVMAAGMGDEHGVLDPREIIEGIGLEMQLEGQRRDGHLWRDIHGEPARIRSDAAR